MNKTMIVTKSLCTWLSVFSSTIPLLYVPIWTYNWMPSGSRMHGMCFFSSDQILSMSGWPLSPLWLSISWSIKLVMVSTPRVRQRQWSAKLYRCLIRRVHVHGEQLYSGVWMHQHAVVLVALFITHLFHWFYYYPLFYFSILLVTPFLS